MYKKNKQIHRKRKQIYCYKRKSERSREKLRVGLTDTNSVEFSSVTQLCLTLCNPMDCSTPGLPVHHKLPKLTQIYVQELVRPPNHLILCYPLLFLPSIIPSIRIFSNESAFCIRWPKYWRVSASASVLPMNIQD